MQIMLICIENQHIKNVHSSSDTYSRSFTVRLLYKRHQPHFFAITNDKLVAAEIVTVIWKHTSRRARFTAIENEMYAVSVITLPCICFCSIGSAGAETRVNSKL